MAAYAYRSPVTVPTAAPQEPGGLTDLDVELFRACDEGDPASVAACLAQGGDNLCVDSEDHHSCPLLRAAWSGSSECVKLLLAHPKTDPNASAEDGLTALMIAISQDNEAMVAMLAPVSDLSVVDHAGSTAWIWASKGHLGSLKILAATADAVAGTPWEASLGPETLLGAAAEQSADCVALLIHLRPDMALATGKWGRTPLMHAAPDPACVALLLPVSDPNARCDSGSSALHMAAEHGSRASVELLMSATKKGIVDGWGHTPLMIAARSSADCVEALLGFDDPKTLDTVGNNALMHAATLKNAKACEILAPLSDLGRRSNSLHAIIRGQKTLMQGKSALDIAAGGGDRACVEAILAHMPLKLSAFASLTFGIASKAIFAEGDLPKKRVDQLRWLAGMALRCHHPLWSARAHALKNKQDEMVAFLDARMLASSEARALSKFRPAPAAPSKSKNRL